LNWRSELSKKIVFNFNSNYSYYVSDINGLQALSVQAAKYHPARTGKGKFGFLLADNNHLEMGGDFINYIVNPGNLKQLGLLLLLIKLAFKMNMAMNCCLLTGQI